jgi:Cu/Ag efflux protein CusF
MKTRLLPPRLAWLLCSVLSAGASLRAADVSPAPAPAADAPATVRHPLKGVIVDLRRDPPALLVKHEAIPGYMMGMTMLFRVDAATLAAVAKGDAITATLVEKSDGYWLEDVKPAR